MNESLGKLIQGSTTNPILQEVSTPEIGVDTINLLTELEKAIRTPTCIVDILQQKIVYCSSRFADIFNTDPDDFSDNFRDILNQVITPNEYEYTLTIVKESCKKLNGKHNWNLQIDLKIKTQGAFRLFTALITPILVPQKKSLRYLAIALSPSPMKNYGSTLMTIDEPTQRLSYDLSKGCWETLEVPSLSKGEINMLRWASHGYSIKEIVEISCLSEASIRKCRQRIFNKLNVSNISAAILVASRLHII